MASEELASKKRAGGYPVWTWTVTKGLRDSTGQLVDGDTDAAQKSKDPVVALNFFITGNVPSKSITILKDFHMYLKVPNPMLIRLLKEAIGYGRRTGKHLVIIGCQINTPPELEKEILTMDMPLPSRKELEDVVSGIAKAAKLEVNGDMPAIVEAMTGLTTNEAADAVSFSVSKHKKLVPATISRIKTETVRKNGIVEIVDASVTLDDIGGLNRYKQHLVSISHAFTAEAKAYGLSQPQPIIAVGNPGTAKSMSSMACKTVFKLPLVRLEAGRLFGGLVGESERNWRTAFATARAISPVILWIDEAEGLFSGMKSSGQCDGGTTSRVVKAILQDMQMNSDGVFFVFTSNDIDGFPDPLIDRCDVWAFDLPNEVERESIWSIHIKKRGRKPKDYDTNELAKRTDGFSGRQIEQAWVKCMLAAFNDGRREPTTKDAGDVLDLFVPTSVTMKDQIERRRKRLENRAQSAS
jgi:SpoVK/Ycf46/Vps4 family AAA+-type ATPase